MERIGPAQRHLPAEVVARHRQAHLIDIAAQQVLCCVAQCGQLGADRTGRIVHDGTGEAVRPVPGHRGGGRLLQGLVGEQPLRHISQAGEFGERLAAQSCGFDQCGGALTESLTDRGHIGQQAGIGESENSDLGQRRDARRTGQIVDIGAGETQDGLTPVIMTL